MGVRRAEAVRHEEVKVGDLELVVEDIGVLSPRRAVAVKQRAVVHSGGRGGESWQSRQACGLRSPEVTTARSDPGRAVCVMMGQSAGSWECNRAADEG